MTLGDSTKVVTVCRFVDRSEREKNDVQHQQQFTNLYVKNLPASVKTQEDLEQMFAEYGEISSAITLTVRVLVYAPSEGTAHHFGSQKQPHKLVDAAVRLWAVRSAECRSQQRFWLC
jgi:RNA recognition motif. (a.k.a. RRM, RBD, or RNP domain)